MDEGVKLSWAEVLAYHRTLRGIGLRSLLVDQGESGYLNRFLPDGRILYSGEGRHGHQTLTPGNRRLLAALEHQSTFRIFARRAPNVWRDLGEYRVAQVEQVEAERRRIYLFTLEPARLHRGP
jgi:hypothetical protein